MCSYRMAGIKTVEDACARDTIIIDVLLMCT
jgi:hypothetical protein